jgi:hypothetical protein
MPASIRNILLTASLAALAVAAGCTVSAPDNTSPARSDAATASTDAAPPAPTPVPAARTPQPPSAAPPMSDPLPPEVMPSPVTLDYSCRVDSDCAVKNVGNCCGMMPACVNRNSPTDLAAVQAECARSGMSSVCGFVEIAACGCVSNRCEPQQSATH